MAEFKVIETQEQLDEIIKARLEREGKKIRKEFEGFLSPEEIEAKYKDFLSPEQVAKKFEGYLSPEDVAKKDSELAKYKLNNKRVEIALEKGIPYKLANRLKGETVEELEADAEVLAEFVKSGSSGVGFKAEPNEDVNSIDSALGDMLGKLNFD